MSPRELRNQVDFFSAFRLCSLNKGFGFVLEKLPLRTFPFGLLVAPFVPALSSTNLYCSYSITKFIFIVNRWFRRLTSKFYFCQISSFVKFYDVAGATSNFMRCQILINQLQTSYTSCQILNQLQNQLQIKFDIQSLYIYISPFIITQIKLDFKLLKLSNLKST